jgi:hypothetical protein
MHRMTLVDEGRRSANQPSAVIPDIQAQISENGMSGDRKEKAKGKGKGRETENLSEATKTIPRPHHHRNHRCLGSGWIVKVMPWTTCSPPLRTCTCTLLRSLHL